MPLVRSLKNCSLGFNHTAEPHGDFFPKDLNHSLCVFVGRWISPQPQGQLSAKGPLLSIFRAFGFPLVTLGKGPEGSCGVEVSSPKLGCAVPGFQLPS